MSASEAYWSRVLLAYPSWYREQRADEVLGVLMEADERRPVRETLSLVRHGLSLRLRDPRQAGAWRPALGVAGLVLVVVMGTYGVWLAYVAGQAAIQLRWQPDPASVPWVDPMWHVAAGWVAAFGLVLLRRPRLAAVAAWLAVAAHVALLLGAFGNEESLAYVDGDGPYRTVLVLQVAPTLVLALLLLRSSAVGDALARTGRRLPLLSAGSALVAMLLVDRAGGDWQVVAIVGGALALVVMQRQGVLLRGTLAATSGIAVVAVAQPLVYRSWFGSPGWGALIVVAITAVLLLVVLVVGSQVGSSAVVRRWAADRVEVISRAVRPPVS